MSCDRCENIHEAQRTGRTNRACECECHFCSSGGADVIIPTGWTNDAGATLTLNPTNINTSGAVGQNY